MNTQHASKLFKVDNVVNAHVQVQSKSTTGAPKKLSYQERGSFQITEILGANAYMVRRYNDKSSTVKEYKGSELYLLPPSLFPNEKLNTMDQRYNHH